MFQAGFAKSLSASVSKAPAVGPLFERAYQSEGHVEAEGKPRRGGGIFEHAPSNGETVARALATKSFAEADAKVRSVEKAGNCPNGDFTSYVAAGALVKGGPPGAPSLHHMAPAQSMSQDSHMLFRGVPSPRFPGPPPAGHAGPPPVSVLLGTGALGGPPPPHHPHGFTPPPGNFASLHPSPLPVLPVGLPPPHQLSHHLTGAHGAVSARPPMAFGCTSSPPPRPASPQCDVATVGPPRRPPESHPASPANPHVQPNSSHGCACCASALAPRAPQPQLGASFAPPPAGYGSHVPPGLPPSVGTAHCHGSPVQTSQYGNRQLPATTGRVHSGSTQPHHTSPQATSSHGPHQHTHSSVSGLGPPRADSAFPAPNAHGRLTSLHGLPPPGQSPLTGPPVEGGAFLSNMATPGAGTLPPTSFGYGYPLSHLPPPHVPPPAHSTLPPPLSSGAHSSASQGAPPPAHGVAPTGMLAGSHSGAPPQCTAPPASFGAYQPGQWGVPLPGPLPGSVGAGVIVQPACSGIRSDAGGSAGTAASSKFPSVKRRSLEDGVDGVLNAIQQAVAPHVAQSGGPSCLEMLDLCACGLDDIGAQKLFEVLTRLQVSCRRLMIAGNGLSDMAVTALAGYLWHSPDPLWELALADNRVTEKGVEELMRCLYNHPNHPPRFPGSNGVSGAGSAFPLRMDLRNNQLEDRESLIKRVESAGGEGVVKLCITHGEGPAPTPVDPSQVLPFLWVFLPRFHEQRAPAAAADTETQKGDRRDKHAKKDKEKDKDKVKEKDSVAERNPLPAKDDGKAKEKSKDSKKNSKEKTKDKSKDKKVKTDKKDRAREKEKELEKERERERQKEKEKEAERARELERQRELEREKEKERQRERAATTTERGKRAVARAGKGGSHRGRSPPRERRSCSGGRSSSYSRSSSQSLKSEQRSRSCSWQRSESASSPLHRRCMGSGDGGGNDGGGGRVAVVATVAEPAGGASRSADRSFSRSRSRSGSGSSCSFSSSSRSSRGRWHGRRRRSQDESTTAPPPGVRPWLN
eukprot:TRINITY_DN2016_c0_g1_i3.p1 TRINITY_DN2016_c0_g1~~TRINITY_DN2016_c0_g1_i3.p1  ORF type:complete len:1031 (-),score=116.83 TRINITY_DN2016_c0_g1_i3:347-3439(-)